MWLRKIFQIRSQKLDKLCDLIYQENIEFIYYFLKKRCQLSDDECCVIMQESIRKLAGNIEDYWDLEKEEQNKKFFLDSYRIAKQIYPKIKEVQNDSKKLK